MPLIFADLLFCARDEMVVHLDDLLRRRMPLFIFNKISVEVLRSVALRVSAEVGWDEVRVEQEVARCSQFVAA